MMSLKNRRKRIVIKIQFTLKGTAHLENFGKKTVSFGTSEMVSLMRWKLRHA